MLRLISLGELRLLEPDGAVLRVRRRELLLLVYLVRCSPRKVPRESLAALLWGDGDDGRARHSLRQALFELKHTLGPVLEIDQHNVSLRPGHVVLDADTFVADVAAGRLSEAVAHWRGEFLAGLENLGGAGYRQWLEEEREGLRRQLVWALERLTEGAERARSWREMAHWAELWTAVDPLGETGHRQLILALHQDERTAEALALHARFMARLRQDADAGPSPEFARLVAGIEQSEREEAAHSPAPGSTALFAPDLIGREAELGELRAAWATARSGLPVIVVLEGDKGSGRTRLAEAFLRTVEQAADPAVILRARAHVVGRDARASDGGASDSAGAPAPEDARLAATLLAPLRSAPGLGGAPDRSLADLSRLVPNLRERFPDLPPARSGEPALEQALVQVIGDIAAETPVIIFVDDLAATDPASRRLIAALARRLPGAAILLLVTADDADRAPIAELRGLPGSRRIRLRPLTAAEVDALIGSMLACTTADRRELATRLHAEGRGNPRFVADRVTALVDSGRLGRDTEGYWRLAPADDAVAPPLWPMNALPHISAWRQAALLPIAVVVIATLVLVTRPGPFGTGASGAPVVAIGLIRDYSGTDSAAIARALPDMLATNLARVPALQVISQARMYEILEQHGRPDPTAAMLAAAARRAGAGELIEGELYAVSGGRLRLELRHIDLESGHVQAVHDVEAADVLALVHDATHRLARDLTGGGVPLRAAGWTTASLVAYRLYEEGLKAHYQGDLPAAQRLFRAALAEDSVFGLAAYYAWRTEYQLGMLADSSIENRIHSVAERAPERERLLMRGLWASLTSDPTLTAVAETLVARYPAEPDGHFLLARGRLASGEFLSALPHLRRVIRLDSLSLSGEPARCRACDALANAISAYSLADSLPAAERVAREWVRLQPGSGTAWGQLAGTLEAQGRINESLAAHQRGAALRSGSPYDPVYPAILSIRAGRFDAADRLLREQSLAGTPAVRAEALWFWTISLRYQGRLGEALTVARALRQLVADSTVPLPPLAIAEAQVLFEIGRYHEAAAIFDSLAAFPPPDVARKPFGRASWESWRLTHAATARAAAGDTAALPPLIDSIQALGAQSSSARDHRLHHYVRALLFRARGRNEEAIAELYRAVFSLPYGYSRNNLELADALLAVGRPAEAVRVLQPAFRGWLEVGGLYTTRPELHLGLGRAFEAAGQADSAAVHYRAVLRAWRFADPPLHARRDSVRARIAALPSGATAAVDR